MKLINFKIKDSIYFVINDKDLDIHNNYNCSGFCYNFEKRQVIVSWNVGTGDWIPEDIPSSLELIVNDVSMLKTTERDSELPFSDDYFDIVFSLGVIEHVGMYLGQNVPLENYRQLRAIYARELLRVTKPKGRIFIAAPNKHFPIDIQHGPYALQNKKISLRGFLV